MQIFLREFLFWVCVYHFHQIVSKIASKENDIADFLSRNSNCNDANDYFSKLNLPSQTKIYISESDFTFKAKW